MLRDMAPLHWPDTHAHARLVTLRAGGSAHVLLVGLHDSQCIEQSLLRSSSSDRIPTSGCSDLRELRSHHVVSGVPRSTDGLPEQTEQRFPQTKATN